MIVQDRAVTPIIVLDDNELKSRLEYDENIEINNNTIGRNIEEGADQGQTNKIKYKGDKKGALRHGFGVLYNGDVIIYEGNFSNDEYHGKTDLAMARQECPYTYAQHKNGRHGRL